MKRKWFEAKDGTYFRNCPLIMGEINYARARPWLFWRVTGLQAEWDHVFRVGVSRKDKLGSGDELAEQGTFREAYPGNPGLWLLDEDQPLGAPQVIP